MPKINVAMSQLVAGLEADLTEAELESLLEYVKGELDDQDDDVLKIELNDTNRPDLWSESGLIRQLRLFRGHSPRQYPFFSSPDQTQESDKTIIVDPKLSKIRPYIAACVVRGAAVDDAAIVEIVQMQEKLSENFGRRRSSLAMGVYSCQDIQFPVHYRSALPSESFHPLDAKSPMTLAQILLEHPKGMEYASILAAHSRYPLLIDANDQVLSFPPIINSNQLGRVVPGDSYLFIECTGTMFEIVCLAISIVACNFSDLGYEVEPVQISYADGAQTTPYYFQKAQHISHEDVNRFLGVSLSSEQVADALEKHGISAMIADGVVTVHPPAYRNDFLHGVDILEDIMIGCGMHSFAPELPQDFTVGKLSEGERLNRQLRDTMVGLGYQEMIFHYLGSREEFIEKMYPEASQDRIDARMVVVNNPLSANFEYLRNSIFPSLLKAESISAASVYPHNIFELGKVCALHDAHDTTLTRDMLGFLSATSVADFNAVHREVSALLYYLSLEYRFENIEDERFISGRCARILSQKGKELGIFGEVHPQLLSWWDIQMPCTMCEIDVSAIVGTRI